MFFVTFVILIIMARCEVYNSELGTPIVLDQDGKTLRVYPRDVKGKARGGATEKCVVESAVELAKRNYKVHEAKPIPGMDNLFGEVDPTNCTGCQQTVACKVYISRLKGL